MVRMLLSTLFWLLATTACAAVDLQKLTQETQKISRKDGYLTLVWWMPQATWDAMLTDNAMLSAEGRTKMLELLDHYMLFLILRAQVGGTGAMESRPKAEMVSNARLEIDGKSVEAIPPENLPPAAQAMFVGIKPVLASILGKFGQGVEVMIYPSTQDAKRLIDPLKPGSFRYVLYDQAFTWRLPLASLLPVKVDAKTGTEFPGDYQFNPYTGDPLTTK